MRKLLYFGMAAVLLLSLSGCGGGSERTTIGPGLVGIDDSDDVNLAPLLTVTYRDPVTLSPVTVDILSDPASDGDIAFDPVRNEFIVTTGPFVIFFGVDHDDPNRSEFRGFLTFPLDGVTGQPVVPSGAQILFASVTIFIDQVHFFSVVPTFLDLVEYPFRGLAAVDFDASPLAFRTLDVRSSDVGGFLEIEVTSLMDIAQVANLLDFQVRYSVDRAGTSPRSLDNAVKDSGRTAKPVSERTVRPARERGARDAAPLSGARERGRSR